MPIVKKPYALLVLLILFIGSIAFLFNDYLGDRDDLSAAIYQETSKLQEDIADETNRFGNERVGELELIAKYIAEIYGDDSRMQTFLKEQDDKMPFLAGLGFITPKGEIMAADGSRLPVKQWGSFERAMNGHMATSNLFTLDQDPDMQVTAIAVPVEKDGEIIGVLSGVVSLSDIIHRLLSESTLLGTVYLLKDDHVVYTSDEGVSEETAARKGEQIIDHMSHASTAVITEDKKSAHYIFYTKAWDDWVVAVDSEGHPGIENLKNERWHYAWIGLGILGSLIGIYLYILRLDKKQRRVSRQDLLTGLGNLLKFEEDGDYLLKSQKQPYTIIILNLREFKRINNWTGYENGDKVLIKISERITEEFEEKHSAYRIGGGEFALLLPGERTRAEAEACAARLCEIVKRPLYIEGYDRIKLEVYAGIRNSESKSSGKAAQLIHDAIFATQEARKRTGVTYAYFTEELELLSAERKLFSKELSEALARREFKLFFQPIYSFEEDAIVSFETLLRWDSEEFGMVSPDAFIPLLEESGMILPVGEWIIEEAALQVGRWRAQGFPFLYVTVNVSVKQLLDESFIDQVQKLLAKTNTTPDSLVFEITESVVVEDSEKALLTVTKLNEIGISTALDDFGTGYSSLAILRLLPFQYLKVDKSFIDDLDTADSQAASVLKGVVAIASGLGQVTIIEGVETKEQLELLRELGADRIQGYYFSKPVPPEQAFLLLE